MRKTMLALYLLSTIVLLVSASGKNITRLGPPQSPPCFPCSEEARVKPV
jgi:hypothetical protein